MKRIHARGVTVVEALLLLMFACLWAVILILATS